jgi:hypothetical protein
MDSIVNPGASHLEMPRARSHPNAAAALSIHRYLPVAAFYFFFNHAGLPVGLFYTTLFSPFLFIWLYLKGQRWLTAKLLLVLSPFILAHLLLGIPDPADYARTLLHWWTVYIAVFAICWSLRKCWNLGRLFEQLIVLNFCAAIIALIIRPTPLRLLLWMDTDPFTGGAAHLLRLNLFTHEPSAYAELMLPLLVFAFLRLLRDRRKRSAGYLMMIVLPFLLCQSFGGISIGVAGIGVSLMTGYRRLLRGSKSRFIFLFLAISASALLLTPNPISRRVLQVATGADGSANARTTSAYIAAYTVASSKSLWWGAGLSQTKSFDFSDLGLGLVAGSIPNEVAGVFAEFGLIGVMAMLAVEIYLFFKTRVYRNSFRIAMFVVAFLQQATGSYATDVQQYLMWFLAFYPFYPEFDLCDSSRLEVSAS